MADIKVYEVRGYSFSAGYKTKSHTNKNESVIISKKNNGD